MSAERLLAHYEKIVDAPDAIARLRRFILDLAVRGKLMPQKVGDEPATELLERIAKERAERIRREEMRRGKIIVGLIEEPFEPPAGWVWLRLGETGNISSGNSVNEPTRAQLANVKHGRPFIATKDVGYGRDRINYENGLLVEVSDERFKIARPNTVLICAEGGSAGKKVGLTDREICFGNKLLANEMWSVIASKFVLYAYMSEFFYEQFSSKMKGVIGGISIANFLELPFPLPPLAEQHRIVAKVDELMGLCDRLEAARAGREAGRDRLAAASLARLNVPNPETFLEDARFTLGALPALTTRPDQIKGLRQTILNLAVRGKLVPQDPQDEPASELLKRIGKEIDAYCAANRIGRATTDPILDDDLPFAAPNGWEWSRLSALFKVITDGDHQPPPKADKGVAFLTIGNVTTGRLDFAGCRLVSEAYFKSLAPYRRPTKGDILYTVVGATYGRPALIETDRPFCVQRHIAILKPVDAMSLRFLLALLTSPLIYDQATRSATGTAQPTIALRPLRHFLAPIPPVAEQHRIVAKVDALLALCDRLEANLTATAATRGRLLDALLAEVLAPTETGKLKAAK